MPVPIRSSEMILISRSLFMGLAYALEQNGMGDAVDTEEHRIQLGGLTFQEEPPHRQQGCTLKHDRWTSCGTGCLGDY